MQKFFDNEREDYKKDVAMKTPDYDALQKKANQARWGAVQMYVTISSYDQVQPAARNRLVGSCLGLFLVDGLYSQCCDV